MGRENIDLASITKALANNEFEFFYQPLISFRTGNLFGAEALIRWKAPDGSFTPASKFIPLAEETGFITEITKIMFQRFLSDTKLIHQSKPSLKISFNICSIDLMQEGFAEMLLNEIDRHQIDPNKIVFEITERTSVFSLAVVQNNIRVLGESSVILSLDDFGAGYSSIDLIRDYPISSLKIDQGFTSSIFTSDRSSEIVNNSISLAHHLGIISICEGIETAEILEYVAQLGSEAAQGYFISRPLPLSDFLSFEMDYSLDSVIFPIGTIHLLQQSHVEWRRKFVREILSAVFTDDNETRKKALSRIPNLDPNMCRLGKWLAGDGQSYRVDAHVMRLETYHLNLHQQAKEIAELAKNGMTLVEAREAINILNNISSKLYGALTDLFTHFVIASLQSHPHVKGRTGRLDSLC